MFGNLVYRKNKFVILAQQVVRWMQASRFADTLFREQALFKVLCQQINLWLEHLIFKS